MAAESSVEMEETTSLEALFSEHNYFKTQAAADDVEPMETAESATPLAPTQTQSPSLTQLDSSKDTFETCLIQLLHAYTTNQRGGTTSPPSAASTPQSEGGASGGGGGVSTGGGGQATSAPFIDISPESLSSLSPEQVSVLVTSNSVNYEVIQQIMAQKQGYQGIPMKAASLIPGNGNNGGQLDPDAASNNNGSSGQSSRQQTPDGISPSPAAVAAAGGGGGGSVVSKGLSGSDDTPPVGSPLGVPSQQILKNPLQITPEHLQLLQQQVNDLLRSKQISLPADMTSQQQQMLIHSILLKQLKEKQQGASASAASAASVSGTPSSLPQPPPSSSMANSNTSSSLAIPSVSARVGTSGRVIAVVKKEPSLLTTSQTLGNLLSSSDMSGQSVAAVKAKEKEEKKEMNPTSVSQTAPQSTLPPSSLSDTKPSLTSLPPPPSAPTPVPVSSSSTAVKQPSLPEPSASATAAAKGSSSSSTPAPAGPSSSTSPPTTRTLANKSGGGGGGRGKKKGESNKNEPKK